MGIRPEHVKLHSDRTEQSHYGEGKVYVVEPLGSEVIYDVEIGSRIVRIKVTEQEAKRLSLSMADRVFVEFPSDSIYLFDKETEKTIAQAGFANHEEKHR